MRIVDLVDVLPMGKSDQQIVDLSFGKRKILKCTLKRKKKRQWTG